MAEYYIPGHGPYEENDATVDYNTWHMDTDGEGEVEIPAISSGATGDVLVTTDKRPRVEPDANERILAAWRREREAQDKARTVGGSAIVEANRPDGEAPVD